MTYAMHYFLGALAAASLAMAWFNSGLPAHVMDLLRALLGEGPITGKAADAALIASRNDWDNMLVVRNMGLGWWRELLVELLSCRVCLSFHISLWVSIVIAACYGEWKLVPAAVFTWPYIVNFLLSTLDRK